MKREFRKGQILKSLSQEDRERWFLEKYKVSQFEMDGCVCFDVSGLYDAMKMALNLCDTLLLNEFCYRMAVSMDEFDLSWKRYPIPKFEYVSKKETKYKFGIVLKFTEIDDSLLKLFSENIKLLVQCMFNVNEGILSWSSFSTKSNYFAFEKSLKRMKSMEFCYYLTLITQKFLEEHVSSFQIIVNDTEK